MSKMKIFTLLMMVLFSLFLSAPYLYAGADGMCPLPTELKIKVKTPAGEQVYSPGDTIYVDEDEPIDVKFLATPFGGGDVDLSTISTGAVDSGTTSAPTWQPDHMHPTFNHEGTRPPACWVGPDGHEDWGDSHQWGGTGWKIKDMEFNYSLDYAGLGHNEMNESGSTPAGVAGFKYNVPSVPKSYKIRVELGLSWQWSYSLSHRWVHDGRVDATGSSSGGPDTKCDICGESYTTTTKDIPFGTVTAVVSDPRLPNQRGGDPATPNWDHVCVENCSGTTALDRSTFLTNSVLKDPDTGAVGKHIVRTFNVIVRDKSNIAHIQTGFNGNNVIKGECGQLLSTTDPDKKITIRIVDNAACATDPVAIAQNLAADAKFKDDNFELTFWYEWPVYQYGSYFLSTFKEPDPITGALTGPEHKFCNVIYSPMFVWKKGKAWGKLSEYLNDAQNSGSKFGKPFNGNTQTGSDAEFVVYDCTFPLDYLLKGDEPKEDIAPFHYAATAYGDSFGNPGYAADKDASALYNTYKPDGKELKDVFKYNPINFKGGKGPLKYFVEVRDCSDKGGGKGETKFNCSSHYFKDTASPAEAYVQAQLKYNPDSVPYMVQSAIAATDLPADGTAVLTTGINAADYCESDDYATDNIQKKWKDCDFVKNVINANVEGGDKDKILKNFQAWGKIEIEDKIKPNLGVRITNTVKQTTRRIYKKDGYEVLKGATLPEFSQANLDGDPNRKYALMDQAKKFNYTALPSGYTPAPPAANAVGNEAVPFDNTEDEWVFDAIPVSAATNKLYEGDEGGQDANKHGYGVGKDIQMIMTHQDLCDANKAAWFTPYYAYDNIDGQRIPKDGQQFNLENWYKGVAADNKSGNTPIDPVFAKDFINKGYTTWLIKDELCDPSAIDGVYKSEGYFNYPQITFSNVNTEWTGNPINNKEISVTYAVIDKNKNKRKLTVKFFVAPTDSSIITIEKQEKRND